MHRRPCRARSCKSLCAKEQLIIGLFCGKGPVKIRCPMHLGHSASNETGSLEGQISRSFARSTDSKLKGIVNRV